MPQTVFSFATIATLVPAAVVGWRAEPRRDRLFWISLGVGVLGPAAWSLKQIAEAWQTDFSTALWVTVTVTMALFAGLAATSTRAWRLTPLLGPYMLCLAFLAAVWQQARPEGLPLDTPAGWVTIHIVLSVITYGLVTVAAVAALAAFLQERALKRKRPTQLTHGLPSVADCDSLLFRLLMTGEVVLGLGLASGMATRYGESGVLLTVDQKTVLTISSFVVIGVLLAAHYRTGIRGKVAARLVLLAYLLLTLGYPGVKFVTDVLLG